MTTGASSASTDTSTTLFPGKVITNIAIDDNDIVRDIAVMPDGRILLAGESYLSRDTEFSLARYNPDGTPDFSFSDDGRLTTKVGSEDSYGFSVDLLTDGRILMTGLAYDRDSQMLNLAMSRYTSDGALDGSFSGDGRVTFNNGRHEYINLPAGAAVMPDGGIVIVSNLREDVLVERFHGDGTPDPRFGQAGGLVVAFAETSTAFATVAQPDGRILLIGQASPEYNVTHFAVARLNANGTLDTTFSGDGVATVGFGSSGTASMARGAALQADGKIVIAGAFRETSGYNFAVARLNPDGTLDNSFSRDGLVTTDFSGGEDRAYSVAIQPDGKILVGGFAATAGESMNFALARYHPDGRLDSSFSDDGKLTIDFEGSDDRASAISILANGQIIIAGSAHRFGIAGSDFALARINADGSLDRDFGAGSSANTPPLITSWRGEQTVRLSMRESEAVVTTITAKDMDGDVVRYSISGGDDKACFRVDSTTGVLSFLQSPDFEAPADFGKDNNYEVIVSANDGRGGSDSQTFNVGVLDLFGDISGSAGDDKLVGTDNSETIQGLDGHDTIQGRGGPDSLIGGNGIDTAVYSGTRAQYRITENGTRVSALVGTEGNDNLREIERLAFSDQALAFDIDGHAGTVARYLGAVFGKSAINNKIYVGLGLKMLDDGVTDAQLMQLALEAKLGPTFTPSAEIDLLYRNLAGRAADASELAYWAAELGNGTLTGVSLAQMAAQLEVNASNIGLAGLTEVGLPYVQS